MTLLLCVYEPCLTRSAPPSWNVRKFGRRTPKNVDFNKYFSNYYYYLFMFLNIGEQQRVLFKQSSYGCLSAGAALQIPNLHLQIKTSECRGMFFVRKILKWKLISSTFLKFKCMPKHYRFATPSNFAATLSQVLARTHRFSGALLWSSCVI